MNQASSKPPSQRWAMRLAHLLSSEPADRDQLLTWLQRAHERQLIDQDALSMMEGALKVSELCVRDVMVPRSQMDVVGAFDTIAEVRAEVVDKAHSRFPVIDRKKDEIVGVLFAKDLVGATGEANTPISQLMRPALFVPASKRLNALLREFRSKRYHLGIVVDEYGNVAGLITIEDVLEEIVGQIEDEYDLIEDDQDQTIVALGERRWRVQGLMRLEEFAEHLGIEQPEADEAHTVGGLLLAWFGAVPATGDTISRENLNFTIEKADARRIHTVVVELSQRSENRDQTTPL